MSRHYGITVAIESINDLYDSSHRCYGFRAVEMDCQFQALSFVAVLCTSFCFPPQSKLSLIFEIGSLGSYSCVPQSLYPSGQL